MNGRRGLSPSASLRIALTLLLAWLCLAVASSGAAASRDSAATMWTRYWQCRVRATPGGTILTELDRNQEIRVIGGAVFHGARWDKVLLWGALHGWVEADLLAGAPLPVSFSSGGSVSPSPVGPHAPMPLHATAVTSGPATLRRAANASAPSVRSLHAGIRLSITHWATDSHGRAWYGLAAPAGTWVDADQVQLAGGRGTPNLAALRGLGMWLTPAVLDIASPQAIVAAAAGSHVTHLYVEVAGSNDFYGAKVLEHLLPVAHKAHIAVLAWVYPYLDDVPKDVTIALQAADFVATTGDRPDGIAADVEQNMQEPYVRAYSQILRARLGAHALMIIAAYPPQSYWGELFPFRLAMQSWNVAAPMDYWDVSRTRRSESEAYDYVATSIAGIRAATRDPATPVEPVGQMFDVYGDGRHSPTSAEILGAIHAAQAGKTTGISFFEWNHATPGEWDALRTLYKILSRSAHRHRLTDCEATAAHDAGQRALLAALHGLAQPGNDEVHGLAGIARDGQLEHDGLVSLAEHRAPGRAGPADTGRPPERPATSRTRRETRQIAGSGAAAYPRRSG